MNPNSLSYPFPLVLRVHVRVRASSGFDRGVGLRGRGRYPLKPIHFASLLETKGYSEHTLRPDLKIMKSLVLCSTQCCTYIFATMLLIETFLKIAIFPR